MITNRPRLHASAGSFNHQSGGLSTTDLKDHHAAKATKATKYPKEINESMQAAPPASLQGDDDGPMTGMTIKENNKRKIYRTLYTQGAKTKGQIVDSTQISLSTVDNNLKLFLQQGLIEKQGFNSSSGGRKAQFFSINPKYRIALGMGVLQDHLHIVAVDLKGNVIGYESTDLHFAPEPKYFNKVHEFIASFVEQLKLSSPQERILALNIAVQGLLDESGETLRFGNLLGFNNHNHDHDETKAMPLSQGQSQSQSHTLSIQPFIEDTGFVGRMYHDSKAAAFYECWTHPDLEQGTVFLLNRNLGGAIVVAGEVVNGLNASAGIIEHMCVDPKGELCYCGARGCLESYCSANALQQKAGMPLSEFFDKVRQGDKKMKAIWKQYLLYLSRAIYNVNMLINGKIILSGYLMPFMTDKDIDFIHANVVDHNIIPLKREDIILGNAGDYTPALGAALYAIDLWLNTNFMTA